MAELTAVDFKAAKGRGDARLRGPRAQRSRFDPGRNRIIVRLTTGMELGLAPGHAERLRGASTADLKVIEVEMCGLGIQFLRLDVDLYVPALLQEVMGSSQRTAARLGAEGGWARSAANMAASRANGKRGRRPRLASGADEG